MTTMRWVDGAGAGCDACCMRPGVRARSGPATPAAVTPTTSAPSTGVTDYDGLVISQVRATSSALPHGVTDHPAPLAAATVPSTSSALPGGLTDYQGLFTTHLRPNDSPVPPGLTDAPPNTLLAAA